LLLPFNLENSGDVPLTTLEALVQIVSKNMLKGAGLALLIGLSLTAAGCSQESSTQPSASPQSSANAPQSPSTEGKNSLTTLKIAFASRKDSKDLERKTKTVADFLSKEIGIPVEAVIGDETAAVEALNANRVDVAFFSSRPALKAAELTGARLVLAEVREDYSGGHTYKSLLLVRNDSPLEIKGTVKETLEQLKGKKIAFASRTSGSGFIIPIGELVGQKLVDGPDRLENYFGKVTYGDGYGSAMQAVLRGQADVGAVSEYAVKPPYITEAEAKQLRVLHAIPGVPAHGISIDDDVPAAMQEKIINALLKLNEPANNQMLRDLYNSTKLVKVDHDQHLGGMRDALKRAKL